MKLDSKCFRCQRHGHIQAECTRQCGKCLKPVNQHTVAGLIECAWRGHACETCGWPPHPDGAPDRCARYRNEHDSFDDRAVRQLTPWRRDNDRPCYYRAPWNVNLDDPFLIGA